MSSLRDSVGYYANNRRIEIQRYHVMSLRDTWGFTVVQREMVYFIIFLTAFRHVISVREEKEQLEES